MQHKGTVRLETDRLILRRIRLDDSGAAFRSEENTTELQGSGWTTAERLFKTGPVTNG